MKYLIRHGIFLISCISSDRRNESRILKPTTRLTLHGMWISLGTFGCVEHEEKPERDGKKNENEDTHSLGVSLSGHR